MSNREVGSLRTRLSWEDEGATRSLKGFREDLRGLRSEMNVARSSGREYANSLKGLREQSDILTRRLQVQREQVNELRRRYEESRRVKGEDAQQTKNLANQYNNAVAAMNRTEEQLKRVTNEINHQINPWQRLSDAAGEHGRKLESVGRSMTSFGRSYTMRVTTPILGAGAAALKVGMDFEEGMSNVQALTGATGSVIDRLSEQARELGATTRFSATEAANAMGFLGMAGWEAQEIMSGMPGVLNLAASSKMDLARAADITSNIMSAFNLEATEASRVSDLLAYAASNANTNVEQMGEGMKYLAPIANTLGMSIEDATAALMGAADAGIQGSMAGRTLASSLSRLASPTAAMEKEMKKLKISFFDADGAIKPLPDIIADLERALDGADEKTKAATLSTLFGTEAQKNWAVLLDQGSDALRENSEALANSEGAAKRMADVMNANAKGNIREFRSALEGVGIALSQHMIPAFTRIIERATELVRKFGDLDDEQQQQIIKWGLLIAAIGPASVMLGSMITTLGGVLKAVSLVSGAIAAKGGLVAALGMLSNPITATIAGVGLLAGGIYLWNKRSAQAKEVNLDLAKSMIEQHEVLGETTDAYEELRKKSNLTTEEFGRLLDLQEKINKAADQNEIDKLNTELEELKEKSGLSNEELDKMVGLNSALIEKVPESAGHITEQGNRVVDTTESLRKYNEELAEATLRELEKQRIIAQGNEKELKQEILNLQAEINEGIKKEEELREKIRNYDEQAAEARLKEIEDLLKSGTLQRSKLTQLHKEKNTLENQLNTYRDQLVTQMEQNDANRISLDQKQEELGKLSQIDEAIAGILLKQLDINETGEEGIRLADERLAKLREQKAEIEEQIKKEGDKGGILGEQLENLNEQIRKHESILGQIERETDLHSTVFDLEKQRTDQYDKMKFKMGTALDVVLEMDRELRKDATKKVKIDDDGEVERFNMRVGSPITKLINLKSNTSSFNIPAYADGTGYHPGGPALHGEEGFELAKLGNSWSMLDFGISNLPRGTQVFTHDESKKILSALNRLPAYSTGISSPGEAQRVVSQLNNNQQNLSGEATLFVEVVNEIDGYELSRKTYKTTAEFIERDKRVRESFA